MIQFNERMMQTNYFENNIICRLLSVEEADVATGSALKVKNDKKIYHYNLPLKPDCISF